MPIHPRLAEVTNRIRERSAASRAAYLQSLHDEQDQPAIRDHMGCANLAHAWAALPVSDKLRVRVERAPHLGIISAYNDMLSAHQPYEGYPQQIREIARAQGATVQVAAGVPAMCDGITQGRRGMEMSLLSRDLIAQALAIGLSHEVFDGVLCLGVCDKIVPGLLIGSLHFGHLPTLFVPAGPMPSGLSNQDKARLREQAAQGLLNREGLLETESKAYHAPGTCTFYGTANSNQMLLEAMGLHVAGAAFAAPEGTARRAYTRQAVIALLSSIRASQAREHKPMGIGQLVDERVIVNAMVALLATGGSTNHLIHWVAVARAAGIRINWDDFDGLSEVVPLIAKVYPNGDADVNAMQAAGGPLFILAQLLDAGLIHGDVPTVSGESMSERLATIARVSADTEVLRSWTDPFQRQGGLRVLRGNLGRAVIKVSAVPEDRWRVRAPARVFTSQEHFMRAFDQGEFDSDCVVVVKGQGPRACGMPELHKLTPPLAVLQNRGLRVALVTDGRMSGASGKIPAAIHLWPEAVNGGLIDHIEDGDWLTVDAHTGRLELEVAAPILERRRAEKTQNSAEGLSPGAPPPPSARPDRSSLGRSLFDGMRSQLSVAEDGACAW
jgi:phosphogluconate dehydratase